MIGKRFACYHEENPFDLYIENKMNKTIETWKKA